MKLLPSRGHSVYTIQLCSSLKCLFMQSHVRRVHVCLAVTCHLQFWQNGRDLLRVTAITQGWNGYRVASEEGTVGDRDLSEKVGKNGDYT